jgi:hypothetical protein
MNETLVAKLQAAQRGRQQRVQLRRATAAVTSLQARYRGRRTRCRFLVARSQVLADEKEWKLARQRRLRLQAYERQLAILQHLPPSKLTRYHECVSASPGAAAPVLISLVLWCADFSGIAAVASSSHGFGSCVADLDARCAPHQCVVEVSQIEAAALPSPAAVQALVRHAMEEPPRSWSSSR